MPIFDKSSNSLFETLGRSRQEVLSKKPVIPPPGTLLRPSVPKGPPVNTKGPKIPTAIERAVDDLLDVDGDPILVVDDELDVDAITPEDADIEEPPSKLLGLRADTAVVFGIGLVLVVAIAYFAGRTGKKDGSVAVKDAPEKPSAAFVKPSPNLIPQVQQTQQAAPDPVDDTQPAPPPPPPPKPVEKEGNYEIAVVTTSKDKAEFVAKYFNEDMRSPTYGKGFTAVIRESGNGFQVRIKGFEKQDPSILSEVKEMRDPSGGGNFKDACYRRSPKKK
jgi:hypothetical protein